MKGSLLQLLGLCTLLMGTLEALWPDNDDAWLCCSEDVPKTIGDDGDCSCSDRMHDFPGWTSREPLPSPWYSGYLTYEFQGRMVHTHYILVLAEDDEHHKKPLIYWSNGGPGASSMFGLLTELGPLVFNDKSTETEDYRATGIPTPLYNRYSWSKLGHLLIFDAPAPVGFSYCQNLTKSSVMDSDEEEKVQDDSIVDCAGLAWTDELASANSFLALQTFYQKYPKLASIDLFLTGESYAGIYIPTLAREIIKANNKKQYVRVGSGSDDAPQTIPLRGFAVGDGCLGTETGICGDLSDENAFDFWYVVFLAGHNQIPLNTFQEVLRACQPFSGGGSTQEQSPICQAALAKVGQQAGGVYAYSLYDECTYRNGMKMMTTTKEQLLSRKLTDQLQLPLSGALNDYTCGGDLVLGEYLKLDMVRDSFHVGDAQYYETDNGGGFAYTPTEKDLTGFYREVALNTNISVLIYNGDTDPSITSFAAQNWTSHLGLDKIQDWRPWTVDGCRRMGGHVTRYEGSFDFLTIRGSGHMVPTFKPAASFVFLQKWLQAQDYPYYVSNCSAPVAESSMLTAQE